MTSQEFPHTSPHEFSEVTIEDDVVCTLITPTQGIAPIRGSLPLSNVVTRGELATDKLPKENFNFQWDFGGPNILEVKDSRTLAQLEVLQSSGEATRSLQRQ
jgi:hypothetical protein